VGTAAPAADAATAPPVALAAVASPAAAAAATAAGAAAVGNSTPAASNPLTITCSSTCSVQGAMAHKAQPQPGHEARGTRQGDWVGATSVGDAWAGGRACSCGCGRGCLTSTVPVVTVVSRCRLPGSTTTVVSVSWGKPPRNMAAERQSPVVAEGSSGAGSMGGSRPRVQQGSTLQPAVTEGRGGPPTPTSTFTWRVGVWGGMSSRTRELLQRRPRWPPRRHLQRVHAGGHGHACHAVAACRACAAAGQG